MQSKAELTAGQPDLQRLAAASDMYQLLAMFLRLPTEEMAAGILNGSLQDDVAAMFAELNISDSAIEDINAELDALPRGTSAQEELCAEMRREYTRLFTHPKTPVIDIYETLFLFQPEEGDSSRPSLFISPAAMDAERCYRQAGLVKAKAVNEPGDHMATELEFMMYLYSRLIKAFTENHQEESAQRQAQIREFSDAHLQKWAVNFFDRCASCSESKVYQAVGRIGSIFLSNRSL